VSVKRCILFVAHAQGSGDFRGIVTHHLDLLPIHAASVERRIAAFGDLVASALLVENEKGEVTMMPSRGAGMNDREYQEFLASCEDWAKGR
jgi:hypothetical protein